MKRILFIILLFVSSVSFTQTYQDYLYKAIDGDAESQYNLGNCWFHGWGTKKNVYNAVYWWKESAEQDYAPAQYVLGLYYLEEEYGEYDEDSAFYWIYLAMANDYTPALFFVGKIYWESGDKSQGNVYIQQAAMLGDEEAIQFIKDHTDYVLSDRDVKQIDIKLLKEIADKYTKKCPLDINYAVQLVKVTMKKKEFVYSLIFDEDYVDFDDLLASKDEIRTDELENIINSCKVNPNKKQVYKALIQNNVTLVYLYKGSKTNKIMYIKFTPLELKRKLKL